MANPAPHTFQQLARTARRIAETGSTGSGIRICAEYFESIADDRNLSLAARFLGEGVFSSTSGNKVSIGSRTIALCAARFCEIDYEKVFKPSKAALGSTPETIEKLMRNIEAACNKRDPQQLTLLQAEHIFNELSATSTRTGKQQILWDTWTRMTPVEINYFIRTLGRNPLRTGLGTEGVIAAIAKAFHKDAEDVRYAHTMTGSIGETAVLSKNNRLEQAVFRLFHPVPFMFASPARRIAVKHPELYAAEEKLEGLRCQAHISRRQVTLYSLTHNDITGSFPEVARSFLDRELPGLVLDGVLCVVKRNTILPLPLLQKRMNLKKPDMKAIQKYPVLFIVCDVLYYDGHPFFRATLTRRRRLLEKISNKYTIPIVNQFEVTNREDIEILFERALEHGNEGVILKEKDSIYEYGQRTQSWLEIKSPGGMLHAAIMYAHSDPDIQNSYYSGFTLGIRVKEDKRYEEEFIPIGKVSSRYPGNELEEINKRLSDLAVEKYGPTLGLIPEIVVEVEFDDIRINKRTKANYTLRGPRFKTIRQDLQPGDVHTLKDVERMYREKINRKRLKQDSNPSFLVYKE